MAICWRCTKPACNTLAIRTKPPEPWPSASSTVQHKSCPRRSTTAATWSGWGATGVPCASAGPWTDFPELRVAPAACPGLWLADRRRRCGAGGSALHRIPHLRPLACFRAGQRVRVPPQRIGTGVAQHAGQPDFLCALASGPIRLLRACTARRKRCPRSGTNVPIHRACPALAKGMVHFIDDGLGFRGLVHGTQLSGAPPPAHPGTGKGAHPIPIPKPCAARSTPISCSTVSIRSVA